MSASPSFPRPPSEWQTTTHTDNSVAYQLWQNPQAKTGKALFIIHGFGEHSGRYEHFPFFLNNVVDAVFIFDLPGHGKSAGARGHINRFDEFCQVTHKMLTLAQGLRPQAKWYFLGHSMGGLIALKTIIQNPALKIERVTLSAPLLDLSVPVSPIKKTLGLLIEPIWPSLSLKNDIDPQVLSHDPQVVAGYASDPLNHNKISPRLFKEMTLAMAEIRSWQGSLGYSIQFLIPLADTLVSWQAAYNFSQQLRLSEGCRKETHTFPAFFHEGFNEVNKGIFFNAFINWLK